MNLELSKAFDFLRFPLAVFVVFLHISPVITPYYEVNADSTLQVFYSYVNMTTCKIATCAVPTFFFISGYLFFCKSSEFSFAIYLGKLKNRFKTLFIPYVLWNLLAVVYLGLSHQLPESVSLYYVFCSPANFPLWFLRNLIVLVLVSPVFYLLSKYTKHVGFFIVSLLFVFSCRIGGGFKFLCISIYFFYAGSFMGIEKINVLNFARLYKYLGVVICMTLLLLEVFIQGNFAWYIDNLFLIAGVYTLLIIAGYIVRKTSFAFPLIFASSTFFIYAAHKLGPTYLSKQMIDWLPISGDLQQLIIFLICPILASIICVSVYAVIKKVAPRVLTFLTGR